MTTHLGVDIGGTKTEAVVTDTAGEILGEHRVDTERGADGVLTAALEAASGACAQAGVAVADLATAGVGVPGVVSGGIVHHAVNLDLVELALADQFEARWGLRPVVENDVNAAALGAWAITGGGDRSIAYLNAGTGLGAGIVLNGRLWRGARGGAGEIGHVSVDPNGPAGPDGLPGGLEAYAAGAGIARDAARSAKELLEDPDREDVRQGLVFGLASAIRLLILTLDVDEVIVGGGIAWMGEGLAAPTRDRLREWAGESSFLDSLDLPHRFRVMVTGEPIGAIGAAMAGVDCG